MNAAEFLKLIEEYPLPWEWGGMAYSDAECSEPPGVPGLTEAAPAMAAAILKVVQWAEDPGQPATLAVLHAELCNCIDGFRASLPESLRS